MLHPNSRIAGSQRRPRALLWSLPAMLATALVLEVIGILVFRKIIKINI